jgi:hypothetical protein
MSFYKQQEFDFVERTKEIIKQYDNNLAIPEGKEKYEVTLFLNCMVGLLILPQQEWFNSLPTDFITKKDWGIDEKEIIVIKNWDLNDEDKTVANIARHLRNSIAHYRFIAFKDENGDIGDVKITDYKGKEEKEEEKTFEAKISVESLRKFTEKLTNVLIEKMQ